MNEALTIEDLLEEFNSTHKVKLPYYEVKAMYNFKISRFYPDRGKISWVTSTYDLKEVDKYLSKDNYWVSEIHQDLIFINHKSEESSQKMIYVSVGFSHLGEVSYVSLTLDGHKKFTKCFKRFLISKNISNIKELMSKTYKLESDSYPEYEITYNNGEVKTFNHSEGGLLYMKKNKLQITDYNFVHKIFHKTKI